MRDNALNISLKKTVKKQREIFFSFHSLMFYLFLSRTNDSLTHGLASMKLKKKLKLGSNHFLNLFFILFYSTNRIKYSTNRRKVQTMLLIFVFNLRRVGF